MKIESNKSSLASQIINRALSVAVMLACLVSLSFAASAQQYKKPGPYDYKKAPSAAAPAKPTGRYSGTLQTPTPPYQRVKTPECAEGFKAEGSISARGKDTSYKCVKTFQMKCTDLGDENFIAELLRVEERGHATAGKPQYDKPSKISYICNHVYN